MALEQHSARVECETAATVEYQPVLVCSISFSAV